ncbi:hypothetical protein [Streptomyces sp. 1331.2]|nr:hypothetical protein [Streptomyces sp. 1331.2]
MDVDGSAADGSDKGPHVTWLYECRGAGWENAATDDHLWNFYGGMFEN